MSVPVGMGKEIPSYLVKKEHSPSMPDLICVYKSE